MWSFAGVQDIVKTEHPVEQRRLPRVKKQLILKVKVLLVVCEAINNDKYRWPNQIMTSWYFLGKRGFVVLAVSYLKQCNLLKGPGCVNYQLRTLIPGCSLIV